jgi:hypothetical protein
MTKRMPYDEEIAMNICARISEGESLQDICAEEGLPSRRTFNRWVAAEHSLWPAYARAREAQMDCWSDEIIEIADNATDDYILTDDGPVAVPEMVQRSKLRIETRKWVMSKLASKRYGDKVGVTVNATVDIADVSDEELEERVKARLARLGIEVTRPLLLRHCAGNRGDEGDAV